MVYVTVIMVMVVRQFSNLSTIEEDQKRLLVVDRGGKTEVEPSGLSWRTPRTWSKM